MMKNMRSFIVLCLFVLSLMSVAVAGQYRYSPPVSRKAGDSMFQINTYGWLSEGENSWKISFADDVPGMTGISELSWDDKDSIIYVVEAEFAPLAWCRVAARYGTGSVGSGDNSDKDFLNDVGVGSTLMSESIADTDVETEFYALELYFRITDYGGMGSSPSDLDVFIGYQYYKDAMTDSNGRFTANEDGVLGDPVPFDGLNSTYDFEWEGYKAGSRAIIYFSPKLQLKASGAYLFNVDYTGKGFWNLRDDFSSQSPNFTHDASGTGYEFNAVLFYRLAVGISLNFGYWMTHFEADNGTDSLILSDGSVAESRLDNVETDRSGFVIGLGVNF